SSRVRKKPLCASGGVGGGQESWERTAESGRRCVCVRSRRRVRAAYGGRRPCRETLASRRGEARKPRGTGERLGSFQPIASRTSRFRARSPCRSFVLGSPGS